MKTYLFLFSIHRVAFTRPGGRMHSLCMKEIDDRIKTLTGQNGYRFISFNAGRSHTHVVFPVHRQIQSGRRESSTGLFDGNCPEQDALIKGSLRWKAGNGFAFSLPGTQGNPAESGEAAIHPFAWSLILAYTEVLSGLNKAYGDDLLLNLSFCLNVAAS